MEESMSLEKDRDDSIDSKEIKDIGPEMNKGLKEGSGVGPEGSGSCRSPFEADIRQELPALSLAYIGDGVFELMTRLYMAEQGSLKVEKLHKRVTDVVNAASQSELSYILKDMLTEEEEAVFKRGRNTRSQTAAKHQSITDYRRATGLEALFGWLFLKGRYERMRELYKYGVEKLLSDVV